MKKCALFVLLLSLSICSSYGQHLKRTCATDEKMADLFKKDPAAKVRFDSYQKELIEQVKQIQSRQLQTDEQQLRTNAIVTIPVVVHVLISNPALVTDAVVQRQIDTLNWYYGAQSANDSLRVYEPFRPAFGRTQIKFCLAKRDPTDQPSTGITRKINAATFDRLSDAMKNTAAGGQTAWDTRKYLNMWVVQYNDGTLGGAYLPGAFPAGNGNIGYVVDYRAFGSGASYLYKEYNGGKTAVHEIGHFFNLSHPWGNSPSGNPNCNQSDLIDDTPPTAGPTFGCPDFPTLDACAPNPPGKMSQNHMDYADDACMVLFTKEQALRMEAALNTSSDRVTLLTSNACTLPRIYNRDVTPSQFISPDSILCDPINLRPIVQVKNVGIDTIRSFTVNYSINGSTYSAVNFNGSVPFLQTTTVSLNTANLNFGHNIIKLYTSGPNGLPDENPANDTIIYTVRVLTAVMDSLVEGFEGAFPPKDWAVTQTPPDNITWRKILVGSASNASAYINNFNYAANDRIDNLVTPPIKYTGADSVFLRFDLSAATYSFPGSTAIPLDTLEVLASTDCGKTFTSVYKKFGFELQTIGDPNNVYTDEFFPRSRTEWRRDSINLTQLLGSSNTVQFTFKNTTNYENNIFVDNVNFSKKVLPERLKASGVLVSPNPFRNQFVLQHYLPPTDLRSYVVYNSIGQQVLQRSFGQSTAQSYMTVNMGSLPAGVYTLKLIYTGKTNSIRIMKMN